MTVTLKRSHGLWERQGDAHEPDCPHKHDCHWQTTGVATGPSPGVRAACPQTPLITPAGVALRPMEKLWAKWHL